MSRKSTPAPTITVTRPRCHAPPRSGAGCCAGSAATAATCPGGAPAIRIASWCRSSCCSRPRSSGSRGTTTAFWSTIPPSRRWRRPRPLAVRESWEGLGYYRRAANLHRLAQAVVREARRGRARAIRRAAASCPGWGATPPARWRALPTSARTPAVDTNVARVLRRAFHPAPDRRRAASAGSGTTAERSCRGRGRKAWVFNQAIMELGALVCTARVARCRRVSGTGGVRRRGDRRRAE